MLHVQLGELKKAERSLKEAIKHLPNEPSLFNSYGNLKLRQKDFEGAIEAYQQALSLNPNYPGAFNNLGNAFAAIGETTQAIESYRNALKVDCLYPDAHFNLARLLVQENQIEQAIDHLEQVVEVIPQHAPAQGLLASLSLELNQLTKAESHAKQRLEIQPNHPATLQTLGNTYLKQKKLREAITELAQALRLDPTLEDIHQQLATAYLMFGNRDDALSHYLRHLDQKKELDTLYNIGVIYSDLQRHSDAITYFNQALQINPNHLPTHLNLAAVFLKSGQLNKTINHYQTVLTLDPNNAEVKHILHALQQDGSPEHAPIEYCQNLFDHYASGYDKHLTEILKYTVPQQIHQLIMTELNPKDKSLEVLDLGCGTGLLGEILEPLAKTLIGVDISNEMLTKAKRKGIYTTLINKSLQEALPEFNNLDLIAAADVFPYLGSLEQVFSAVKHSLKSGGYFVFSTEKTLEKDFFLQTNIRYAHNKNYIKTLSSDYGFDIVAVNNSILRRQQQKPVEGYLFLIKLK